MLFNAVFIKVGNGVVWPFVDDGVLYTNGVESSEDGFECLCLNGDWVGVPWVVEGVLASKLSIYY